MKKKMKTSNDSEVSKEKKVSRHPNFGINVVKVTNPEDGKTVSFFLEPWIKDRFDNKVIPDLKKKDKDCVIVIDGNEGAGKSTLGLQWCKYIDPTFNLKRVVFTPEEFREAIYKAKKNQAIMFDEAFTGFSSRAALSGVNKTLISLMMQIRQKNLFIVIVLPTIFLLDKYISIFRTRVLAHVYEVRGRRGFFKIYSSKKKRRLILHKDARVYSYGVYTRKRGRFYGAFALGDKVERKKYEKKKEEALEKSHLTPMTGRVVKYRNQRNVMVYVLRRELKMSYKKIESILSDYDFDLTYAQIRNICAKFGDKELAMEEIRKGKEQQRRMEEKELGIIREQEEKKKREELRKEREKKEAIDFEEKHSLGKENEEEEEF